jgi:hypothetical protein
MTHRNLAASTVLVTVAEPHRPARRRFVDGGADMAEGLNEPQSGPDGDFSGTPQRTGLLPDGSARPPIGNRDLPAGADDGGVSGTRQLADGGRLHWLQALEDAIRFRQQRAARPCRACGTAQGTCYYHARDLALAREYQNTAAQFAQAAPRPLSSRAEVRAGRDLLAEGHCPAAMAPRELRKLLARYQRCVRELLDDAGAGAPETGS